MQHKIPILPTEILLQIVESDFATASTYARGVSWCLVSPSFYKDGYFRRMLAQQWILLDVRKRAPYFRMHAAIAGDVDVFKTASHAWDGLDENLPLPLLTCTEADIEPGEAYVQALGQQFAYNAAVLRITADRGTFNRHIRVKSPAFRHKGDADVYLDCLRYQHADSSMLEPEFLDLLLILCREHGPSYPVRGSSRSGAERCSGSPTFALINMLLERFPGKWSLPDNHLRSSWKLICGGPIHVAPCVLQRMWDHQASPANSLSPSLDPELLSFFWATVLPKCVEMLFAADADAIISSSSHFGRVIDWLCSNDTTKNLSLPCIMDQATKNRRPDVLDYVRLRLSSSTV